MSGYYYKPTYFEFNDTDSLTGILNIDLERRSIESGDVLTEPDNYYPKEYYANYDSVVNPTKNVNLYAEETNESLNQYAYNGNIYKYMKEKAKPNVAKAYFTALGRERNSTYRINEPYKIPQDAKYYQNNSHRYYMYTGMETTWDEAEAFCESVGGHLVTINTDSEIEFLRDKLGINDDCWVGRYQGNWVTGEESIFNIHNPNYSIQNKFKTSTSDNTESKYSSFICEWE